MAETAVIGVPDRQWQEVPRAYVVRKPGSTATAAEIIAHCRAELAGFKTPKSVEFVDELLRDASGKVLKRTLREWAAARDAPPWAGQEPG